MHSILRTIFSLLMVSTVLLGGYAGLWFLYPVERNIEVSSIEIPDSVYGDEIFVEVARSLHGTWDGAYRVTIRRQPAGYVFCSTGLVEIRYRETTEDGFRTQLPDPMTLAYWAHGGDCTARLGYPLPIGLYSVETCHYVEKPLNILPRKGRCWPVTTFRVYESAEAMIQRTPINR